MNLTQAENTDPATLKTHCYDSSMAIGIFLSVIEKQKKKMRQITLAKQGNMTVSTLVTSNLGRLFFIWCHELIIKQSRIVVGCCLQMKETDKYRP